MRVSGFTFIKNGTVLGYPYIESLKSLLMVCDEVIVALGKSDDDTLSKVQAINDPRLRIIETTWNDKMHDRGYTYAQQKMIAQFNCTGDWAFYLEGDEIIHEKDVPLIRAQMEKYLADTEVEALVFDYYHFYGCPELYAYSPRWYRKAPRIIRNSVRSWAPDGLFWLIMNENKRGRYPFAALVGCHLYHYGHVRSISNMQEKNRQVATYWGHAPHKFDGYSDIDSKSLKKFVNTHPAIVQNWIKTDAEQTFTHNSNYKLTKRENKHRIMMFFERLFGGIDLSKKHYRLIRK